MAYFELRHTVTFEETNLVGNVYYVNHLRWQGACRELFLKENAPSILQALSDGLALVTLHCSCDYLAEVFAFDEISVRMRLESIHHNQIRMLYEYWRASEHGPQLVARGRQHIACMQRSGGQTVPCAVPGALQDALNRYSGELQEVGRR